MRKVYNLFYIFILLVTLVGTYFEDTHQRIDKQLFYNPVTKSYHYEYHLVHVAR